MKDREQCDTIAAIRRIFVLVILAAAVALIDTL